MDHLCDGSCCSTEPPLDDDLPSLYYFECDAGNLGCRAIRVYASGRVMLAYPGGPYGEYLPEGELPPKGEYDVLEGFCREMTETEFNLLWLALDVSDPNT